MPLLEDYQNLLEQEERRKTLYGNADLRNCIRV